MLAAIRAFIESHLDSQLTIDRLASELGISTSHFARSFRFSVGMTPHEYVMGCRLRRARQLLTGTNLTLIEIALQTGFADQSHFSRRFQAFSGYPPRVFRKQQR